MDNSNLNTPGCSSNKISRKEKLDKNLPSTVEEASITSHSVNASSTSSGLTPQINTNSIDDRDNTTASAMFPNSSGPAIGTGTPIHTTSVISDVETPIIGIPSLSADYHKSTGLGIIDKPDTTSHGHDGMRGRMHDMTHRLQGRASQMKEKASHLKDDLTEKAGETGSMLKDKAGQLTDRVRNVDYHAMADSTLRPIRSNPEKSIFIAAGVGFVLGLLAGRGTHSNEVYDKRVFPYHASDEDNGCC